MKALVVILDFRADEERDTGIQIKDFALSV